MGSEFSLSTQAKRVAVITGAGRGIGRSHALAFAAANARVVVNDLGVTYAGTREGPSPADAVVEEIRARGGEAVADYNDVASWSGAEGLLATALNAFGRVDVLVNNAAIVRPAMITDVSEIDLDEIMRVNIKGTFGPTRCFAEHWANQAAKHSKPDAAIICTTSRVGLRGTPYYAVYGLTKAAVASLVEAAAAEFEQYGIRVNGIAPRAATRMMGDAMRRVVELGGEAGLTAVFAGGRSRPPAGADQEEPESISPLVVWLASAHASFVSGRIFSVMGGRIALLDGMRERHAVLLPARHSTDDVERVLGPLLRADQ